MFGGGKQIDSGAAEAARIQAETARQNAEREELRWQNEQARIQQEKESQRQNEQAQQMDRQRQIQLDQDKARSSAAAQGAAGAGVGTEDLNKGRELAGFQKVKDNLEKEYKSSLEQAQSSGYLGQSNSLLSKQGVNTRTYK
jgi:hypothetical protein